MKNEMNKNNIKQILLSEIKIPKEFVEPSKYKLNKCRKYYVKHKDVDKKIIINKDGLLVDGYVRYLVLKENNVEKINAVIYSPSYKSIPTKYVFAQHFPRLKEYCWRITDKTVNQENLKIGNQAIVWTKYGKKVVKVTRIEVLDKPPIDMKIKKVIECLEN